MAHVVSKGYNFSRSASTCSASELKFVHLQRKRIKIQNRQWCIQLVDGAPHTCRVDYLEQTLTSLAQLPGLRRFSVYVSQDGHHEGVAQLTGHLGRKQLTRAARRFEHWQRDRVPQLGSNQVGISV